MATMRISILLVVFALFPASPSISQSTDPPEPPGSIMLLVQSELEYLEAGGHRISIDFRETPPSGVLSQLGKKVRLSIEIHCRLPDERGLTATFRHATVREILEWVAREMDVYYKLERPDKLVVLKTEAD